MKGIFKKNRGSLDVVWTMSGMYNCRHHMLCVEKFSPDKFFATPVPMVIHASGDLFPTLFRITPDVFVRREIHLFL